MRGSIALDLRMYDSYESEYVKARQEEIFGRLEGADLGLFVYGFRQAEEINLGMECSLQKENFEIFLCQFKDILESDFECGGGDDWFEKRYLVWPTETKIGFRQYRPFDSEGDKWVS
jgi:hypothetical protein